MWNHLHIKPRLWIFQGFKLISLFNDYFKDQHLDHEIGEHPISHSRQLLEAPTANGIVPSCVPPSIDEFPDDFFSQEQRLQGGIIVHVLIVAYVCCMLAKVCDRYFVPSLGVLSSYFNVPPDIAGATFMAIGTSSPELFSSAIGSVEDGERSGRPPVVTEELVKNVKSPGEISPQVTATFAAPRAFVTEGDIGVGTVVGSAVFNILAVTGASGLTVGTMAIQLDWYPISRDCFMYIITISSLVYVIHDNVVTWYEATALLAMFLCYIIILCLNTKVKKVATGMVDAISSWCKSGSSDDYLKLPHTVIDETTQLIIARFPSRYESYDDSACPSSTASSLEASLSSGSETFGKESGQFDPKLRSSDINPKDFTAIHFKHEAESETERSLSMRKEEMKDEKNVSLWSMPEGKLRKIVWLLMWPANFLFYITIPDCSTVGGRKWFPITFLTSIFWLGVLSYLSFWMVAIIGYTLGIPDTVAGITILAAGTSVPELVASIIVVRSGLGNMALCNLISSNIFDILFCLGAPWLVKALLNTETKSLVINSSALTYTTLILLSTVVLFYISLSLCKWKLSWRTGIISFTLYIAFLVLASLYETNIFGDFNPPPCSS